MKILGPILISVSGAALGALLLASREKSELEEQVAAPPVALPPTAEIVARLPTFKARLTGYYPFIANLTAKERKMEGGVNDRTGRPLIAIEQHLLDYAGIDRELIAVRAGAYWRILKPDAEI